MEVNYANGCKFKLDSSQLSLGAARLLTCRLIASAACSCLGRSCLGCFYSWTCCRSTCGQRTRQQKKRVHGALIDHSRDRDRHRERRSQRARLSPPPSSTCPRFVSLYSTQSAKSVTCCNGQALAHAVDQAPGQQQSRRGKL